MISCLNLSAMRKCLQNKKDTILFDYKMRNSDEDIMKTVLTISTCTVLVSCYNLPVSALDANSYIISKFQPIVNLIQGLGYPVCMCSMTCGGVMMAFNRKKGVSLIKDGAIAYLVIQFVPMLMKILSGVGSEIK